MFRVVERYLANHGYAPTLGEIARLCGYASRTSAHKAVWSLIEKGYLAGEPGRTLRLGDLPVPAPDAVPPVLEA